MFKKNKTEMMKGVTFYLSSGQQDAQHPGRLNKLIFLCLLIALLLVNTKTHAQVVNAYAKVTGISGNVLTLSNINESNHSFVVGDLVIIMQMQDDVIGSTTNDPNFGTLGAIGSAGRYEIKTITARTATTLTVQGTLTVSFNTGANSSVQIISFRVFGSPNFTTTADMSALAWDGNVGGVLAVKVNGTLTLNHSLSANGAGFRGGSASNNGSVIECNTNYITSDATISGEKGEGIYKRTNANYQYGRGKIVTGGGGGNRHNAGGAGGGNYSAGGNGGGGYNCTSTPVGGQGGVSLQSVINISRIFLGGGGGGGQQNNSVGTNGARGGGIILIKADQIITSATCTGRTIAANGVNSNNANDDGTGGAGAGGSIILDVPTFSVVASCPLTVSANGGNGGSSLNSTAHGGGGAGGQGYVAYTAASISNVTIATNNGSSGCNNNSSPCNSQAPSPSGTNNAGVNTDIGGTPLPITLLDFKATLSGENVMLNWSTATEINNDFFVVERTKDAKSFEDVTQVNGAGNSYNRIDYETIDAYPPPGKIYYRLKQVDFDGQYSYSKMVTVDNVFKQPGIKIAPNPVSNGEVIKITTSDFGDTTEPQFHLSDLLGHSVAIRVEKKFNNLWCLRASETLAQGIYVLRVKVSLPDRDSVVYAERILFLPAEK